MMEDLTILAARLSCGKGDKQGVYACGRLPGLDYNVICGRFFGLAEGAGWDRMAGGPGDL
jgi:hypothetical protein